MLCLSSFELFSRRVPLSFVNINEEVILNETGHDPNRTPCPPLNTELPKKSEGTGTKWLPDESFL